MSRFTISHSQLKLKGHTPMKNGNKWILAVISAALLVVSASSIAQAADNECHGKKYIAPLVAENDSGITGSALVCIADDGVTAKVRANNLVAGDAYTLWFIYFDVPSTCLTPGSCNDADVFTPLDDPAGSFGRYDSIVAGNAPFLFSGHSGLQPSSGSVISLEIVAHGTLADDGKHRGRQLLTPQIPILGAPGLGTSSDGTVGNPIADAQIVVP
jgi:hypothetical protein